eukprot:3198216-Pyramimonas_sp.AAC.1
MPPKKRPAAAGEAATQKLKRPAAWHDHDDDHEPEVDGAEELPKDEDAPDGVADSRSTTRAQRHALAKNKHLFDPNMVETFNKLMDPSKKVVGKQARINQIIKACVSRKAEGGKGVLVKERSVQMIQKS